MSRRSPRPDDTPDGAIGDGHPQTGAEPSFGEDFWADLAPSGAWGGAVIEETEVADAAAQAAMDSPVVPVAQPPAGHGAGLGDAAIGQAAFGGSAVQGSWSGTAAPLPPGPRRRPNLRRPIDPQAPPPIALPTAGAAPPGYPPPNQAPAIPPPTGTVAPAAPGSALPGSPMPPVVPVQVPEPVWPWADQDAGAFYAETQQRRMEAIRALDVERQAEAIRWTQAEYAARYRREDDPFEYRRGWLEEELRLPGAGLGMAEPLIVGPLRPPGVRPNRTPLGPIWIKAILAILAAAVASYLLYLLFGNREPDQRGLIERPPAVIQVVASPADDLPLRASPSH